MTKTNFRLFVTLALAALVLAACGGAAGTADMGTQQVPDTGSTSAVVNTPGATAGTGAGATCVGFDTQQLMTAGQAVYSENCAGCHGEQGEGVGDFPPLAADTEMTTDDVAGLVTSYFQVEAHPKTLPVEDLAGVLTFVRGSFGNTAGAICPDQIVVPAP